MNKCSMLKSTLAVTVAMLVTRILGLVREAVLAAVYGAGMVSDAFITSFTIPNTILACIGTSLATVYVPLYHENKEDASKFTSNIISIVSLMGFFLTILFIIFPKVLVSLFAAGFDSDTYNLTVQFTRIMMLSTIPILLFNVLKAYLQIFSAFFWATALDAVINILVILGIGASRLLNMFSLMAYCAVVGNFICFICLFYSCEKYGLKYIPYLNVKEKRIKKIVHLIFPVFIGTAVAELNTIIDRNFASSLVSGTVSAMNYANKINGILYSFLSTSIVTVLYPQLVKLVVENKEGEVKQYINKCVLILAYIILPLSVIIFILAKPIVGILFQRGSFSYENTIMTAECVQMYAIGYLTVNINPVLNRVFYAHSDTKTPTKNSIMAVALNILMNILLIKRYKHVGVAFSTSIASILTTVLLLIQLSKKLKGLQLRAMGKDILKIVISSIPMTLFLIAIERHMMNTMNGEIWEYAFVAFIVIVGGFIYVAMSWLLKVGVVLEIKEMIVVRSRRKNG